MFQHTAARRRLLDKTKIYRAIFIKFQHTAARRRLLPQRQNLPRLEIVSTHSRAKAAATNKTASQDDEYVSTHSRAKAAAHAYGGLSRFPYQFQHTAARRRLLGRTASKKPICDVSTHSRAKAAAGLNLFAISGEHLFQHTAARRRLRFSNFKELYNTLFQHTAARRRLRKCGNLSIDGGRVSTHSRAKAAAHGRGLWGL